MKLQEMTAPEIYRSGIDAKDRVAFRMVASKKSFKILSSTIYKYKIRAIIREVSCNAIDGHVAAGNSNPFDVQLPTVLDPRFIVRDYGVGLSDKDVQEHATVYFESSKTDSNDFIGSLGLGFKSPFCYSDTFNIVSWHGGYKRTYVAYMEDGEPYVDILEEIASDEPVGVQIIVPAKVEDVEEWTKEARFVYESFVTIQPNFIGVNPDVNYQPAETTRSDGMIVHDSKIHRGVYARMGNIMYPIDKELYEDMIFRLYVSDNRTYIFDFPLGDLDFMPSREELSLDKLTKSRIIERLNRISGIYHQNLLKEFNKRKTIREKVALYRSKYTFNTYMNNKADFHINGNQPGSYVPNMDRTQISHLETFGFWANMFGSASRCQYRAIGRYATYKNETQSRLNVTNIIDPSVQTKLYLVEVDTPTFKSALAGYCMMKQINKIVFIDAAISEDKLNEIIKYGHFEESDIIRLKTSEMTEEVKAYEKKFQKTVHQSTASSEPRPKTPTAIMYSLIDGEVEQENLFLTKKEFLELPPVAGIKIFGMNEYSPIETEGFRRQEVTARMMKKTGIHKVIFIRNSLWKWIPDSNVYCYYSELQKQFISAMKKLKANGYSCIGSHDYTKVLFNNYGITLDRLVKNRYDSENYEIAKYAYYSLICPSYRGGEEQNNKDLQKYTHEFLKNSDAMYIRIGEAVKRFEELNPLLYAVLLSVKKRCYVNDLISVKAKEDFAKLIRWK
ncbi:rIIA protector from prophage-induced early lysis [Yersinia phage JC221]|nr:rIIA protector from prophage-induced early lysis [Yersinia phage JC221]